MLAPQAWLRQAAEENYRDCRLYNSRFISAATCVPVRPGSYFVSCWVEHKDPFQVDGATHIVGARLLPTLFLLTSILTKLFRAQVSKN